MIYTPPNKIKISSDDNILEFIKIKKVGKESVFVYRFVFSKTKLNMEVDFTELELKKNITNFFKII